MKKLIDEGICVETDTIDMIQWFTQPGEGGGFVGWVRIERKPGRGEIHVRCCEPVPTEAQAKAIAIARASAISEAALDDATAQR